MQIPCKNLTLEARARTFRLTSYKDERLVETVQANLANLERMLRFNVEHGLNHFRLSSQRVPFASHPVSAFNWQRHFSDRQAEVGRYALELVSTL